VIPTPNKSFWIFHSVYWVVAGLALFVYGLRYGHWEIALVRNIYSPLLGFVVSFLMSVLYVRRMPRQDLDRLTLVVAASIAGALLSALIVNPITYGLLGRDLRSLTASDIFTDGLYFVLFYLVWSLLYLQISGLPLFGAAPEDGKILPNDVEPAETLDAITVTKEGRKLKLLPGDITHIEANGDYVEFFTSADSYFKQGTIGSYEKGLDGSFVRIHRSIIVNSEKITAITGPQKGQYWIKLEGDREVRSSRNAQTLVEGLLPKAE